MAIPISGVAHANVNCSRLARSLQFYTALLGLSASAHTAPERPQDCRAFGFAGDGQWDAWMLTAGGEPGGTAIDLLEWKIPLPIGRPPRELHHLGFARLTVRVPELDALHASLLAAGAECPSRDLVRDPDGVLLELIERPARPAGLERVVINCSDLARSLDAYRRALDLEIAGGRESEDHRSSMLAPRGRPQSCAVELVEWKQPRPVGRPAAQPNHLGIFRMAFLVDDAHAAHAELRALGIECPPPVWLEMGPEIPIDGLWAVFFPDPDGTCLELIQSPRVLSA